MEIERIEKRLESQVKLHRIIIKVHKVICSTQNKISTPAIFFDPDQNVLEPNNPYDP